MSQNTEAELERFRQQWRNEVVARTQNKQENRMQRQRRGTQQQYQWSNLEDDISKTRADKPVGTTAGLESVDDSVLATTTVESSKASRPSSGHAVALDNFDDDNDDDDVLEPRTYYEGAGRGMNRRRLSSNGGRTVLAEGISENIGHPRSALEHYERAVEKESLGSLGESVDLYRKAFKLDDGVHETYKNKYFPPPIASSDAAVNPLAGAKPVQPKPSVVSEAVPKPAHRSLDGLSSSVSELLCDFARLSIEGTAAHDNDRISLQSPTSKPAISSAPPSSLSTSPTATATATSRILPCPIATLPEELLTEILTQVAIQDVGSLAHLALVCKRLAFVVMTEERVWKRVALGRENGFAAMHYQYACDIYGYPLRYDHGDDENSCGGGHVLSDGGRTEDICSLTESAGSVYEQRPDPAAIFTLSSNFPTYRQMFRLRPRIRFNGLYISTVNYSRPGAPSTSQLTWNSPVLIVTYYRYLRFYRDGTAISLLTTTDPSEVVPVFHRENIPANQHHYKDKNQPRQRPHVHHQHQHRPHNSQSNVLSSAATPATTSAHSVTPIMKDALRGRWHLSGLCHMFGKTEPSTSSNDAESNEGILHVETEGVVPRYTWNMRFALVSAGRAARNNKLAWIDFRCYNRLADDWGDFGLKNDRPFYWSRVRSYGSGL